MAFAESLATAIALAPVRDLDHLAHQLWQAFDNGAIGEDDAQAAAEALQARRAEARPKPRQTRPGAPQAAVRPRRVIPRSPDRAASRQRRRDVGQERWLPPCIASKLTPGEIAVLSVEVREIVKHGAKV